MSWAKEKVSKACTLLDGKWVRIIEVLEKFAGMTNDQARQHLSKYKEDHPSIVPLIRLESPPTGGRKSQWLPVSDSLPILASVDAPWARKLKKDLDAQPQETNEKKKIEKKTKNRSDDEDYVPTTKKRRETCKTAGCDRYKQGGCDGMCRFHFKETRASSELGQRKERKRKFAKCKTDGCDNWRRLKGLCRSCYSKKYKNEEEEQEQEQEEKEEEDEKEEGQEQPEPKTKKRKVEVDKNNDKEPQGQDQQGQVDTV